jgi:uncharacterized protein (TIGR00369 family)
MTILDQESFLNSHNQGLGQLLGISFVSASRDRVVAQLSINKNVCSQPDVVHGGAIMTLADCASAYGAVLNLPPGHTTATIESKTNFLSKGEGPKVRASSVPLHVGRTMSVWRSSIFRGDDQIAEVTQTQIVLRDGAKASVEQPPAETPGPQDARLPEDITVQPRRTRTSSRFSTPVFDERWRQIFEGASAVIATKGFAKASIREIAAAAGMPVPTMYQYLERKEDLLAHIYEYFMTDIVAAMHQWRVSDAPPHDRIKGLILTMVDWFDRRHRYVKLMFQETRALTPEARQRVYELDARYIAIIHELLDSAIVEWGRKDRNSELLANFIYFLCCIWPLRHWTIGKFGQEEVANEIVNFVLNGIGAAQSEGAP